MKCPQDVDVDLVMSERQGVEIDYCPSCRGVWLDRGELDKILDRAAALTTPAAAPGSPVGHVSGEGGPGPASGAVPPAGYGSGQPGTGYGPSGYPSGGAYPGGGYAGGGDYRGDDRSDRDRYGDDRHRYGDDRARYGDDRSRYGRPGYDPRKKRKESWLGDLLDFG
jgi:Zn-finger nucleic acid-binding protein